MSEHTPLPWQRNGSHIYGPDPDRQLICNVKDYGRTERDNPMMENIDLILRAVNSHDELVRAVEILLRMMDRGPKARKLDEALTWRENDFIARATAEKALAAAKREPYI